MISKTAVANNTWFREVNKESVNASSEGSVIPVYGDFATQVAAKLNEMFKKHNDGNGQDENMIQSLGKDLDGSETGYDYKLGRNDVISGFEDIPSTMEDTQLSVEHVSRNGIGMYDVSHEIAGLAVGLKHPVIFTTSYNSIRDEDVDVIRDLIVKANKNVIVILVVPEGMGLAEVKIDAASLYDLMEVSANLTVFITYMLEKRR